MLVELEVIRVPVDQEPVSLVLMISFCTGVDIMARYQLLNNNNNTIIENTVHQPSNYSRSGATKQIGCEPATVQ